MASWSQVSVRSYSDPALTNDAEVPWIDDLVTVQK